MATNYRNVGNSWFDSVVDEINDKARKAVRDAVEKGEAITKHNIENSGTLKSGKRGRVETGEMRDAVSGEITKDTADEIEGRFGWKNGPAHARYQERGWIHSGSGVPVEGMFALADASVEVLQDLEEDLKDF